MNPYTFRRRRSVINNDRPIDLLSDQLRPQSSGTSSSSSFTTRQLNSTKSSGRDSHGALIMRAQAYVFGFTRLLSE
ncbi:hypothetical protein J6590_002017 [Homalodisca vitripennis]|nr:hypothetical protein J6590_002017 [Homalodisca vitripennis]